MVTIDNKTQTNLQKQKTKTIKWPKDSDYFTKINTGAIDRNLEKGLEILNPIAAHLYRKDELKKINYIITNSKATIIPPPYKKA